jgi:hypothetical protein
MINGLWTAEFASTAGIFGAGVVVFRDGTLLGGDAGYTYIGNYTLSGESFKAHLLVQPFVPNFQSVFNTVGQSFNLNLEGSINELSRVGHGSPAEMPGFRFSVKLTKKHD